MWSRALSYPGSLRILGRAFAYFQPDRALVALWMALIIFGTGLGLLTAWPMAILADTVLSPTGPAALDRIHRLLLAPLPADRLGRIVGLAAWGLAFKLGQDLLNVAQTVVFNQISYNGLVRVRCDLYRKLQALNLAYHRAQPQGDVIHRLGSDTMSLQAILNVVVTAVVAAATLTVMVFVLGSRSVSLTALALSILPVLAITNVKFGRRLSERSSECRECDAQYTTAVQRSLSTIGLVQAFRREADEFRHFHGTMRDTVRAWWRLNHQQMAYNVIIGTFFGLAGAAVFGYGGYLVHRDQFAAPRAGGMTIGDLIVFTSYLGLLWGPLCTLTGFAASAQGGIAGARRVFEVLDLDPVIVDAPDARPLPTRPRTVELRGVTFQYSKEPAARPVLDDVSVTIRPGEMVAFVGASGAGKSTLLNLLPRFYDPTVGSILLDDVDARQVRLADVRKHVALVLQESVILPTTVAENIAYGRPHASREQIVEAARLAGADEFIRRLPDGYDTTIVESGQNLSGGQRQRLSIARAFLTEAPIIVLDEPTSALDAHHERLVTDSLRSMKRLRTLIVVSHRLSTVVDCDRIYVLEHGRVVEQGTHAQLIATGGRYHAMAVRQRCADVSATADGAALQLAA